MGSANIFLYSKDAHRATPSIKAKDNVNINTREDYVYIDTSPNNREAPPVLASGKDCPGTQASPTKEGEKCDYATVTLTESFHQVPLGSATVSLVYRLLFLV